MAKIDTTDLTPPQIGRLDKALAKLYRDDDESVITLREMIERDFGDHPDKEITDGMIDYSRTRFNRMDAREQRDYMNRLKAKRYYVLKFSPFAGLHVPKIVFDAVPGRIVQNVDAVQDKGVAA